MQFANQADRLSGSFPNFFSHGCVGTTGDPTQCRESVFGRGADFPKRRRGLSAHFIVDSVHASFVKRNIALNLSLQSAGDPLDNLGIANAACAECLDHLDSGSPGLLHSCEQCIKYGLRKRPQMSESERGRPGCRAVRVAGSVQIRQHLID